MRCPYCSNQESQVKDSRPSEDGAAIRRRRYCPDCGGRFTTFERVQLRELIVVKKSGKKVPFDRDKLARSVAIAVRKRPVDPERIERMLSGIVRQLESLGETEIPQTRLASTLWKVCVFSMMWPMSALLPFTETSAKPRILKIFWAN
jgi:transcriptional repressor NrdR